MIALVQRVSEAKVSVDGCVTGAIEAGLLVLLGVEKGDTQAQAEKLLGRVLGYRIFPDTEGKMNRSVAELDGGLLLVPQFTLAADTHKGTRPSFSPAAPPDLGEALFDYFVATACARHPKVETGRFGADMKVSLVNDGPVTFWLEVRPGALG